MEISFITKEQFKSKYNVIDIDLVALGLFIEDDLVELQEFEQNASIFGKILLFFTYIPFTLRNPGFFSSFLLPQFLKIAGINKKGQKSFNLRDKYPISNCILKVSIASAFNPKNILEIGTYLGWGAASFKKAVPESTVYSMCPGENQDVNNPIREKDVGYFYKKKNLDVEQIWADSTKFDYSTIPEMGVTYIDGNHAYEYVYKDLENASKITLKCIILDDYIPREKANKNGIVYGPWNEGVVKATDDFLKNNPSLFKEAYWLEGTQLCILYIG